MIHRFSQMTQIGSLLICEICEICGLFCSFFVALNRLERNGTFFTVFSEIAVKRSILFQTFQRPGATWEKTVHDSALPRDTAFLFRPCWRRIAKICASDPVVPVSHRQHGLKTRVTFEQFGA